jgi:Ca2+-binding EF-hand superfamily protein
LIKNASWTKDSLGQLFEKFDTDKSGRISSSEFKRAFEGLGLSASQYDVEQLVRRIDKDGDGHVSFREFVDAVLRPSRSK